MCASQDVEEAVQDALFILYRKVGTLRTVAAFAGWLFRVVQRACQRHARRRAIEATRIAPLSDVDALADPRAPDQALRVDLVRIVATLPPLYREVLVMRDVSGWTAEETAEALCISVEAVKSRLHRARALVRSQMGESEGKADFRNGATRIGAVRLAAGHRT